MPLASSKLVSAKISTSYFRAPLSRKSMVKSQGVQDDFKSYTKFSSFVLVFPRNVGNFYCVDVFCFVFQDSVCLCIPGCPGTSSIDQAGLEPTETHLLRAGTKGMHHHTTPGTKIHLCVCVGGGVLTHTYHVCAQNTC